MRWISLMDLRGTSRYRAAVIVALRGLLLRHGLIQTNRLGDLRCRCVQWNRGLRVRGEGVSRQGRLRAGIGVLVVQRVARVPGEVLRLVVQVVVVRTLKQPLAVHRLRR